MLFLPEYLMYILEIRCAFLVFILLTFRIEADEARMSDWCRLKEKLASTQL